LRWHVFEASEGYLTYQVMSVQISYHQKGREKLDDLQTVAEMEI
jgi:hypothetical protein